MLIFLNEMAGSFAERRAFENDPQGYLARFQDLTDHERNLILSRDSFAIETYIKNGLLADDAEIIPVHAATTVAVIAVLIGVISPEEDHESQQFDRHTDFWSHVASRGTAYAN
ncbi:hypothetical protein [Pseudooceanicola sp.]|uniref:hypothetical protein n=1 Tax=Pseudooceanicola sp. TaxID=1914328 RepID=UPI0035C71B98